jgi:hypothetical protein
MNDNERNYIVVAGIDATTISSSGLARAARDELLVSARGCPAITDVVTADTCAKVLVSMKEFTRTIEASRTDAKAPILDLSRGIDGLAGELTVEVEAEAARISKLLGSWQALQNALAREQARKAQEAAAKIMEEAAEKERVAQARLTEQQEMIANKIEGAKTAAAKERAVAELAQTERSAALAQQARMDREAAAVVAAQGAAMTTAPKPNGIATRLEVCYEITNIVALYEAAPYLVKLEPNVSALKSALKGLRGNEQLPGIRSWWEAKSFVR